ncbi:MAG: hypothetical protein U0802_21640 [Candidatus Binatia bacterium]
MTGRLALALALLASVAACSSKQPPSPPSSPRRGGAALRDRAQRRQSERRGEAKGSDVVTAQVYRYLSQQTTYRIVPDVTVIDTLATPELRRAIGRRNAPSCWARRPAPTACSSAASSGSTSASAPPTAPAPQRR